MHSYLVTFMMHDSPAWYLNLASILKVASRRFEEEEWLFWHRVVQLANVLDEVPTDGYDLDAKSVSGEC